MSYYNGYSEKERSKKLRLTNKLLREGDLSISKGPCELCGDPDCKTEFHSEDYSQPLFPVKAYDVSPQTKLD